MKVVYNRKTAKSLLYEIDCHSIVTSDTCFKYFNATKGDWSFQVKPYREFALLNQIKDIECLTMIFNF